MGVVSHNVLPAGSGAGGDVVYRCDDTVVIIRPHTGNVLVYGSELSGKISLAFGVNTRFELDFPAGTTFVGARLNLWVSTTEGSGSKAGTFGIMDHDAARAGTSGEWTGSDGWAHADYVKSNDIDRPVIEANFFDTAYYADAGHRISEDVADYGANDRFGIASGTLTGEVTLASLLAEIQVWFDDKESLRDTGVGDGIPISFAIASDNVTTHRIFNFFDAGDATFKPTLDLDVEVADTFPFSVTRPDASAIVVRPSSAVTVTLPSAAATVTLPDSSAIITLPDPAATVIRPDETATVIRPDDQTTED